MVNPKDRPKPGTRVILKSIPSGFFGTDCERVTGVRSRRLLRSQFVSLRTIKPMEPSWNSPMRVASFTFIYVKLEFIQRAE